MKLSRASDNCAMMACAGAIRSALTASLSAQAASAAPERKSPRPMRSLPSVQSIDPPSRRLLRPMSPPSRIRDRAIRQRRLRPIPPPRPASCPPGTGLQIQGLPGESVPWSIVVLLTALTLIPSILMCITPFARLLIVFHFLRQALGLQTTPSNQTLIGLSLILTFFLMQPVADADLRGLRSFPCRPARSPPWKR